MTTQTTAALDLSEVPACCPFVVLDASGAIAGWCETEDGAARTCAEWSAIDGAEYTWIRRAA